MKARVNILAGQPDDSTHAVGASPVGSISCAVLVCAVGPHLAAEPCMNNEVIALPPCRTLAGFAVEPGCEDGLAIESLEPGTTLIVKTHNSQYRLIVLDGANHLLLVEGGAMFPKAVPAALQGACAGGSLVKTGWIGVGLRMELFADPRWVRTSRVRSVAIDNRPLL